MYIGSTGQRGLHHLVRQLSDSTRSTVHCKCLALSHEKLQVIVVFLSNDWRALVGLRDPGQCH